MSKQALIVEDDVYVGKLLKTMLSKMDYQCTYAESAEKALDILKQNSFLVIITDYQLPGMTGISFMETVKKTNIHQNFIIMSGHGHKISYKEILQAGASDYLKKPFEYAELTSKILRIEREHIILKELNETNQKLESVINNANTLTNEIFETHQDYTHTINYINNAAMMVDTDRTILKVNEPFLTLFPTISRSIEGKKCYDIFPSSFCTKEECITLPFMDGLDKNVHTREYIGSDNIRIPCKVTCFPVKDNSNQLLGFIEIFDDLREKELEKDKGFVLGMMQSSAKEGRQKADKLNKTYELIDKYYQEMKQTEQKLRNSEQELRLLNDISKTILTIQDDSMYDHILTLLIKKFKSSYGFFGYKNTQNNMIVPLSSSQLHLTCNVNQGSVTSSHTIINQWNTAIETKQSMYLEKSFDLPDGHFPIHSMVIVPIISKNDNVIGLFVLANKTLSFASSDITKLETVAKFIAPVLQSRRKQQMEELERMKAEKALSISHAYREKIIQSMIDPLFVIHTDGYIKQANEAASKLLGYEMLELIKKPFANLLVQKDSNQKNMSYQLPYVLLTLSEEKQINDYELLCRHKDQRIIPVIVSGNVMTDASNTIIAYVCILRDIRGLQEATSQLIEAEKLAALGELTGGIGHELKQPMNVIKIITQSILMDIKRDRFEQDLLGDDLKQITSQVDKMAGIIDHMRIFTGRSHDTEREVVHLNELVTTTFQFFSQQMKAHNIDFQMDLISEIAQVHINKIRIEEVLINLISNARKALEKTHIENKRIIVKTRQEDSSIFLEVQDNGCGVPEHLSDRLFDQFFTTQLPGEGMGLGLSISRKIVQDHGGTLTFENLPEGGALFQIKLPAMEDV
jgi:PAS domain S-box-containing protein